MAGHNTDSHLWNSISRRHALGLLTASLVVLSGCVGTGIPGSGNASTPSDNQMSGSAGNPAVIPFQNLSSSAQEEVRIAIEQGEYSTCGNLSLRDEISLASDPIIVYQDTRYEPVIMVGSGKNEECGTKYILSMEPAANTTDTADKRNIVRFTELPSSAQQEVRTAIKQGQYSACGELAIESAVDLETNPLIKYHEEVYEPSLIIGGAGKQNSSCATHTLQIEQVNGTSTTP